MESGDLGLGLTLGQRVGLRLDGILKGLWGQRHEREVRGQIGDGAVRLSSVGRVGNLQLGSIKEAGFQNDHGYGEGALNKFDFVWPTKKIILKVKSSSIL